MGVVRKVVAVIWFIAVPFVLYYFVTSFLSCLGTSGQVLSERIMYVIYSQILCILMIAVARFSKLLVVIRRSSHITAVGIILDLILAPLKLAYFWCALLIVCAYGILKGVFSGLFSKSGSSKTSGGKGSSAVAENVGYGDSDREEGSDGKLRNWIRNALPSSCPSWPYGHAYADSKTVELSSLSNTIILGACIHFNFIGSAEGIVSNKSELQSSVQSVGGEYANKLLHAASSAFEQFREKYSGYDGEWEIKIGNIDVKMDIASS